MAALRAALASGAAAAVQMARGAVVGVPPPPTPTFQKKGGGHQEFNQHRFLVVNWPETAEGFCCDMRTSVQPGPSSGPVGPIGPNFCLVISFFERWWCLSVSQSEVSVCVCVCECA